MSSVGLDCKVYFATATRASWGAAVNGIHTGGAPALTEITSVSNVTLNHNDGEADVSKRASKFKLTAQALTEADIDIEMPWSPTDVGFQKLLQAKLQRITIALAVLDGDASVSGTQGMWADWVVTGFTREEPINGPITAKFKVKPGLSAVPPEWVQVQ